MLTRTLTRLANELDSGKPLSPLEQTGLLAIAQAAWDLHTSEGTVLEDGARAKLAECFATFTDAVRSQAASRANATIKERKGNDRA